MTNEVALTPREAAIVLARVITRRALGGQGSGNFGHAGRPGEVGGSSDGPAEDPDFDPYGPPVMVGQVKIETRSKSDGKKLVVRSDTEFDSEQARNILGPVDPADVAEVMFNSVPGDVTVSMWTSDEEASVDGVPSFTLSAKSDDGTEVTRTFARTGSAGLEVHHDLFSLPRDAQGLGIAKQVLRDGMDAYETLGVHTVRLDANLNVGGYAWAQFGFVSDDPGHLARSLQYAVTHDMSLPESSREALLSVISNHKDDPKLPWHIANTMDGDKKVGKQALMRITWDAKMDLNDKESMKRFRSYTGAR